MDGGGRGGEEEWGAGGGGGREARFTTRSRRNKWKKKYIGKLGPKKQDERNKQRGKDSERWSSEEGKEEEEHRTGQIITKNAMNYQKKTQRKRRSSG